MNADAWRWLYWEWATETFDRSVPHHLVGYLGSRRDDVVKPMDGWPSMLAAAFSRSTREHLRLTGRPVEHGLSYDGMTHTLSKRWIEVLAAANRGEIGCLIDFGIEGSVEHETGAGIRLRLSKFNRSIVNELVLAPSTLQDVLLGMVGFIPQDCAHVHVVGLQDHGVCLRCCTMRPGREVTLGVQRYKASVVMDETPRALAPPPATPRQPTIEFPSLGLPPAALDSFPVGQAPGEAAAFSAYLNTLRTQR